MSSKPTSRSRGCKFGLDLTSGLPVIQEFLESIHTSRLISTDLPACLRRHLSEMMDRIAKGPEDVKKSVRAADELP
jgi:hypothetical protein